MTDIKTILLVEDNPNDIELTLEALAGYRLANEVLVLNERPSAPGTTNDRHE
jgi:CheY-like chemotaxis protein